MRPRKTRIHFSRQNIGDADLGGTKGGKGELKIRFLLGARGLVKSNREAIVQAFTALHHQIVERDLQEARMKSLFKVDEEGR